MTITPTETDVKSGGNYKNPGNKLYTDLIKKKKKAFVLAHMHKDTKTKNAIVQSIYDAVRKQSPSGRFLQKNKDGTQSVKSKEDAFKKIKKALNENRASIEEYFKLRGQFPKPEESTKPSLVVVTPSLVVARPTHSDWYKLHNMLEEKPKTKRQRLRGMLHKISSKDRGKKSSKKESKNSTGIRNISEAMKKISLGGKGK